MIIDKDLCEKNFMGKIILYHPRNIDTIQSGKIGIFHARIFPRTVFPLCAFFRIRFVRVRPLPCGFFMFRFIQSVCQFKYSNERTYFICTLYAKYIVSAFLPTRIPKTIAKSYTYVSTHRTFDA